MNVTHLSALAVLLVACNGTKEIDDPAMESTANGVGTSTFTVASLATDADEATIQGSVSPITSNLYGLVGQHNAYAEANAVPEAEADLAQQDGAGTVTWDGSHLVIDTTWDSGDGIEYVYEVDLTFGEADGGWAVDGVYDLVFAADLGGFTYDYDIQAEYDALTSDAAGCPISGSFTVDYKLETNLSIPGLPGGSSNYKGLVKAEFDGCNNVTVFGSN